MIGTAPRKASILSFVMEGIHPHDLGTVVDREGVAIRTGQHCAQPVMDRLGIPATARASLAMYNTREDVDALVAALRKARKVFG
jgi:cysteine desulfurase/selenocysteine lyase